MSGLLAVSWAAELEDVARMRFARARDAFCAIKGLTCGSEASARGFQVARFASRESPCPEVVSAPNGIWAAAGWWFDRDAGAAGSSLPSLAQGREPERAFERLQGQYLVLFFDIQSGRLTAAGDRLGMFPVYVAQEDGICWISTSAVSLAAALRSPLDRQAVLALFMGDAIRSPRSAFQGIRRLSLGEQVTAATGRLNIQRAWSPFPELRAIRRIDDAAEEAIALVHRSCAEIQRRWPRWVSDLTSGIDSRVVLAAMSAHGAVNATVNGPADHPDVRISGQICESFGWPFHPHDLPLDWGTRRWGCFRAGVGLAEGELSGRAIDRTIDAKLGLRTRFDASISGGMGEMLRDFLWHQEFLATGRTSKVDIDRLQRYRFFFAPVADAGLFESNWQRSYIDDQGQRIAELFALAPGALNTQKLDATYIWRCSGHFGRYQGAVFPLMVSVMPLATSDLVDFAMSLPWHFRVHSQLARAMIMRMSPELAAMPTYYGGSARPFSLRRPLDLLQYGSGSLLKLVNKFSQVAVKRPIFPDPTLRPPDPRWERGLVTLLEREGFLDAENLRTRELYRADPLRRLLASFRHGDLTQVGQLHALVSVEWLARVADDPQLAATLS
jgi:asparagine synthase (glutamine-hydrolysing)